MNSRFRSLALVGALAAVLAGLGLAPSRASRPALATSSADPARLLETVRLLATHPDGSPRSRFAFQADMDSIGSWLQDRLGEALAPAGARGSVTRWAFEAKPDTCDTCRVCPTWDPRLPYRTTFHNVIGTLEGKSHGQGKFLVTAHYDAIACRTPGWQAESGVAPGADDNATGTAAVLELARLLSQDPQYEFDIEFILFDGEEEILLGSKALAEAYKNRGDHVLGVLNMDMIGYNPRVDSLVVMTNRSSNYLAEFLEETERMAPQPDFTLTREIANIGFSDHGPFWDKGYPGILLIESVLIVGHNPQYHKTSDVPANLSRQGHMMAKGANVFLESLRRLGAGASGPPRLSMSDGDILVTVNRAAQPPAYASPEDTVRIQAGVFNIGGNLGAGDAQTIRLFRVTDGGREPLAEKVVHGPFMNGDHTFLEYTFFPTEADAGGVTIEAEVGEGANRNVARHTIPVRVNATHVVTHYVAPNPVRDVSRTWFCYELSHEANVRLTFFDLHGDRVGGTTFTLAGKPEPGSGVEPGLNRMPLRPLFDGGTIPPGVYLYRLEIFSEDGEALGAESGKFAVVR